MAARRRRTTRVVARAGMLAAAVLAIAGLLAMHALSLHGTSTDGEHGMLTLPAAHVEHMHGLDHADHETGQHTGHSGDDGHSAMLLCAAFLLAAGILLLTGLWKRTPSWRRATAHGWSQVTGFRAIITHPATGPPPVWAYSVIRC